MVMPWLQPIPVSQAVVTAQPTEQRDFQPVDTPLKPGDETLAKAVKACLEAGFSESKVIKEILGYQGGRYQEGKALLERLKE